MKNKLFILYIIINFQWIYSQEKITNTFIKVYDANKNTVLENTFVINMNNLKGQISNNKGELRINISKGDTLLFSKIGYQKEKIAVTEEFLNKKINNIYLVSKNYDLNEVVIKPYHLTGVLDVDIKIVEQRSSPAIIKLKGIKTKNEISKFKPKNTREKLYQYFASKFDKHIVQQKKIASLESNDKNATNLLKYRNDRELIVEILGIKKEDIEQILIECGYPPEFIIKGTDLELLRALESCYLKKKK